MLDTVTKNEKLKKNYSKKQKKHVLFFYEFGVKTSWLQKSEYYLNDLLRL